MTSKAPSIVNPFGNQTKEGLRCGFHAEFY